MGEITSQNRIEREGNVVKIILTFTDDYEAMMIFDKIKHDAQQGTLVLPFTPVSDGFVTIRDRDSS